MQKPIPSTSEYLAKDEALCVDHLINTLDWTQSQSKRAQTQATDFIRRIRDTKRSPGELETFMQHYALNTDEGLALMCLAEALLRIPDSATANALIKDKITAANWNETKKTADWVVRTAGLGLILTRGTLESALERIGAPFIREAVTKAMRLMGSQFVLGETIEDAMKKARSFEKTGYRFSYDMLGEGARTQEDAARYFEAYRQSITALAAGKNTNRPSISVKLSALHPRYEFANADTCVPDMQDLLLQLCQKAADNNIALTVDAEEVDRLEISIQIIDHILAQKSLKDWDGFGMAIQAYQKRALPLIGELHQRCETHKRRLVTRLVKGAYWDTEVKRAQVLGLKDYPVYTRKCNTDLSYLACADQLLQHKDSFSPKFGTHNAFTVAAIMDLATHHKSEFELQRLHGMGETLFAHVMENHGVNASIYAPVGPHSDLLAYLVRRLLENGANSSFVNQVMDEDIPITDLTQDPVFKARDYEEKKHTAIPYPRDLYRKEKPFGRKNSKGIDLHDSATIAPLLKTIQKPYTVPTLPKADEKTFDTMFKKSKDAFPAWMHKPADERADILDRIADLFEDNIESLMHICIHEAGKTIPDAIDEIREAVDFCRYYANQGRKDFAPQDLPGPTGESNQIQSRGRGTFICISPWNFPLAIFTGQVTAALMAGNCVIAKPASPTTHIAHEAVRLMHKAGIPKDVLQLMIGGGAMGAKLIEHQDVAGVAFTGSTEVAWGINRALAAKNAPIVPLIAETGGQNVMFVDSSSLPEQVVDDVIKSAFGSAGQRCSALRILCIQEDAADKVIHMLKGAMKELNINDPAQLSTDIGPVIDEKSFKMLQDHRVLLEKNAHHIATAPIPKSLKGHYFTPCAYEIKDVSLLEREVFGPILHIVRYKRKDLDQLITQINDLGYGLTCGVHSRIEEMQRKITTSMNVGNLYINRTMIGAIVGSQPFGGMGISGTGPKAGGPHYLHAFATEQTICIDTTAAGGNTALVSIGE